MHLQGSANMEKSSYNYSDSKLHNLILSMTVSRHWADVYSNAVDRGWVPTKMGGHGAPDNLEQGYQTQVWLAVSNDIEARVSGRYLHHKRQDDYLPVANDAKVQEKFLAMCEQVTGVHFPVDKS